ncbi:MAG: metal-dependent hydrolase [Euryarchaeota archaeon]|nr:metal-dependent hydrolase [Euryarchaeota archaeon]MBU4607837.1 metal-dependent hydrolase [Euryarchaeota archaeon]MBV1754480.1 metal-dependent hydrolase [Methanobacterium sp.]
MRFWTHIPASLLLYLLLIWLFNLPVNIPGMVITGLISVVPDIIDKVTGKHRGFGHSFIFLAPAILAFMINISLGLSIVSAFITHVALDCVTKKGVPLFYPFSETRLLYPKKEKSRITTGSSREVALAMLIIFCLVPVAYGLTVGMPDLEEIWAQDEELENKTENNSAKEYIKRDYRGYYSPKSEDKKVEVIVKVVDLRRNYSNSGRVDLNESHINQTQD